MEDLAALVINDPDLNAPGFKHSLAGDKAVVKGKVTNITTRPTSIGNLSLVELDDFSLLHLVVWGEVPYEVGGRIRADVRFEWSVYRNETHVYSPQLDFPSLATLPSVGVVLQAVAAVAGTVVTFSDGASEPLAMTVFDQNPKLPLAGMNLSLRVGKSSFTNEYIDVLGIGSENHSYGWETDSIDNIASGTARSGKISFTDSDHDGLFGRNDTLTLANLSRPEQESGAYTCVIILRLAEPPQGRTVTDLPVTYFVMTSRGALSYLLYDTPYARIENEVFSQTEVRFTFVSVRSNVRWDNVKLQLMDGTNFDHWYTASGDLDNGPMSQEELSSIAVGPLNVACTVVDIAGNGVVDEGDCFTVSIWGGTAFSPSTNYTLSVLYEPTSSQMAYSSFHG